MYVAIIAWDLAKSSQTVESLRDYIREYAVEAFSALEGMRLKAWFSSSNADKEIWGAVYLWDSLEHVGGPERVSRAVELIGYPPTSFGVFELEAIAEGLSSHAVLSGAGRALADGMTR